MTLYNLTNAHAANFPIDNDLLFLVNMELQLAIDGVFTKWGLDLTWEDMDRGSDLPLLHKEARIFRDSLFFLDFVVAMGCESQ